MAKHQPSATASKKAPAKAKNAYAVKSDGIYELRGKNYVKITNPEKIAKAVAWMQKHFGVPSPQKEKAHSPVQEVEASRLKEYIDQHILFAEISPTPERKRTEMDAIEFGMNAENDRTCAVMKRLANLAEKICPMAGTTDSTSDNKSEQIPVPPIGSTCYRMQNMVGNHAAINYELEKLITHLEEVI